MYMCIHTQTHEYALTYMHSTMCTRMYDYVFMCTHTSRLNSCTIHSESPEPWLSHIAQPLQRQGLSWSPISFRGRIIHTVVCNNECKQVKSQTSLDKKIISACYITTSKVQHCRLFCALEFWYSNINHFSMHE